MEKIIDKKLTYECHIQDFEGPLDLLLYLITKNKMNIFDISLSDITDEYILYIQKMHETDMEIASEFLVLASTLLSIKARRLLPSVQVEEEQVTEQELLKQVYEYKRYKEVSLIIGKMYLENFGTFSKMPEKIKFLSKLEYNKESVSALSMYDSYQTVLYRNVAKMNGASTIVQELAVHEKVTVRQKAEQIIDYLKKKDKLNFNEFYIKNKSKSMQEIVTAFLTSLELSKLEKITMEQKEIFTDIIIKKSKHYDGNTDLFEN